MYSEALTYGFLALGRQLANVVSDYLARKYDLTPVETYKNPKLIYEALEKSLGYGSIIIETRIIKSLYSQLSLPMEGRSQGYEWVILKISRNTSLSFKQKFKEARDLGEVAFLLNEYQ